MLSSSPIQLASFHGSLCVYIIMSHTIEFLLRYDIHDIQVYVAQNGHIYFDCKQRLHKIFAVHSNCWNG